jgi:phospholipase C
MTKRTLFTAMLVAGTFCSASVADAAKAPARKTAGIEQIETIVVIYAENRSFDNLYGFFPGANGLRRVNGAASA